MIGVFRSGMRRLLFVVLAAVAVFAPGSRSQAEPRVAVSFFYEELAPDGYWVEDVEYGTVWYPRRRARDWQPYVYGRWVWTSDYGWYWDSYEDWGWATYHYGRWVYTAAYGWVWVPDGEWGPAWVEWRTGGGYVGWAPLPPEVRWRRGRFVYAGINLTAPRYRSGWIFVTEAHLVSDNLQRHRTPRSRNAALLTASVRATNYAVVGARIVNRSVNIGRISAATGVRIAPRPVVRSRVKARGDGRTGSVLRVYQPPIKARGKKKKHNHVRVAPPPAKIKSRTERDSRAGGRASDRRRRDHDQPSVKARGKKKKRNDVRVAPPPDKIESRWRRHL